MMIAPSAIDNHCWKPKSAKVLPMIPNKSPKKEYVTTLPLLYKKTEITFEFFPLFTIGKDKAMGPHMPTVHTSECSKYKSRNE